VGYLLDCLHHSQFYRGLHRTTEANGVTRRDLARRLGVSPAYITKVFCGNVSFTVDSMVRLVRSAEGGGKQSRDVGAKRNNV
jgi:transcriptional regulator with XRE-family HTH domain